MILLHTNVSIADTGVCEINTRPSCGHCRTPPSHLMSRFMDVRKMSATGL